MRATLPAVYLDVLHLVAAGASNAEMAAKLHLSEDAAKCRLRRLLRMLGARDRGHAVHIAWQAGLLQAEGERPRIGGLVASGVDTAALVAARRAAGVEQRVMAARLGVSRQWLSRRETGRLPFPADLLDLYRRVVAEVAA